jgi:hypothetical protein
VSRREAALTLDERLALDRAQTGGTMPLTVAVDEAELPVATRLNAGKKHGRMLNLITRAESEARRFPARRGK